MGKKRKITTGNKHYEEIIVPNTLKNYNENRKKGYILLWSGENKFGFLKPIKGDNMKKDRKFKGTNLHLKGFDRDRNGNSIIKLSYPNGRGFSIQTGGNMPKTHRMKAGVDNIHKDITANEMRSIKSEAVKYIKNYGTSRQKSGLRVYKKKKDRS